MAACLPPSLCPFAERLTMCLPDVWRSPRVCFCYIDFNKTRNPAHPSVHFRMSTLPRLRGYNHRASWCTSRMFLPQFSWENLRPWKNQCFWCQIIESYTLKTWRGELQQMLGMQFYRLIMEQSVHWNCSHQGVSIWHSFEKYHMLFHKYGF